MHRFLLDISRDGSQLEFRGTELARVRGEAPLADPYTYVLGTPELVVYRTSHGHVVITCDDVRESAATEIETGETDSERRRRSAMYAESVRPREITESWLVNTAAQWGIPSGLLSSVRHHCR